MEQDISILKKIVYGVLAFGVNLFAFYYFLDGGTLFGWTGWLWNYVKMSFIWGAVFYSAYGVCEKGEVFWGLLMFSLTLLLPLVVCHYRIFTFTMILVFAIPGAVVYGIICILKWLLELVSFPNIVLTMFEYGMILLTAFGVATVVVRLEDSIGKNFSKRE